MSKARNWWSVAVQAVMVTPQLRIELPESAWVRISFEKGQPDVTLRAGESITLPDGTGAEILGEKIRLEPPDGAILFFETAVGAPEISIKLQADTIFEVPKDESLTLNADEVQFPINTRVVLPAAHPTDAAKAQAQSPLKTTQGKVLCWLPDGASFVLCEGGIVTWQQPKSS